MPGLGTVEQAKQAARELAEKNSKNVFKLPPELLVAGKPIKIYNVSNQKWEISTGGTGQFLIKACLPGQQFSEPLEIPFVLYEGLMIDMEHIEFRPMLGATFAQSVVGFGPHRHPTEDLRKFGVFIAAGDEPTAEEIAEARRNLRERMMELKLQGDGFYGDGPGEYKNITKQHRDAVDWLIAEGVDLGEVPWHKTLKTMAECPVCFNPVDPRAIAHIGPTGCGGVINEAAVIKARLRGYEHLWATPVPEAKKPRGAQEQA